MSLSTTHSGEGARRQFFNQKNEQSGSFSDKSQQVCLEKWDSRSSWVRKFELGRLMLAGALGTRTNTTSNFPLIGVRLYINLNQYLVTNGLQKLGDTVSDPRPEARRLFTQFWPTLAQPRKAWTKS